ncbi:MAG: PDZ domain-containing protein [Planctomycetes bacterium]|nr:PDZ domain-containing protein [Planctomycetota bacterium]
MRRPWIAIVVTAAAAFAAAPRLFAGDPPAVSAEESAQIDRLVEDLGSADFRVREAATKALAEKGAKARGALEKGAKSDNPAVRFRADQLLQALDGARTEKPLDDGTADAPPHRADPGVDGAERALEKMRREMETWQKELERRWGDGSFEERSKALQREMEQALEAARRRFGASGGTSPFGPPNGPFGPDTTLRLLEPWMGARGVIGRRETLAKVDGGDAWVEVAEGPRGARIVVTSKADASDVVTFSGKTVDAIVAAQPKVREWPGVPAALEAFAKEKARRAEEAQAAQRRARAATPGAPGVVSGRTVKIEHADGRVRVEVSETGPDGKPVTKTYEGTDLEALKQQHPELRDALGGFQIHLGGPGARWGGTVFGVGPTPPSPQGEQPLTDDEGDGDEAAPLPGAVATTGPFGLGLAAVEPALRKHLGLEEGAGAHVLAVRDGSDASKLGLRVDDVIVKVNETTVKRLEDVGATIRGLAADAPLVVEVLREGKPLTLRR